LFAACELQLLASWQHRGSLLVETTILVGLTAPMAMRRQAPLAATATTTGFLILAAATPLNAISPDAMLFILFIPPYSVAAYARKERALAGLAICIAGWLALALTTTVGPPGWAAVSTGLILVAWSIGRAIRARRRRAERLNRRAAAISSETDDLTRLAIADERTRIARRMQAAVARSVADMTVQTHAARILLDRDLTAADAAMAEIDRTGRRALNEMRALLGVLRAKNDEAELAPQPSIGRLPGLIELTRRDGGDVAFRVQGEPRPIPGISDLTVYRIAEEALSTLAAPLLQQHRNAMFAVTFGDTQVALEVHSTAQPTSQWPTALMVERAHLSGGSIECFSDDSGSVSLRLEVPAEFEEVLL
jgi:signal transduction histidine kinase